MYSLQHVFWRGAMALSLLVLGGVGAGVSEAPRETARACPTVEAAVHSALIEGRSLDEPAVERELCDLLLRYLLP